MFVQVIQGRPKDAQQVRSALDQWAAELAPDSIGWLGMTAGVTDDGRFIAVVRFESEEAAQRNSDRPEQDAWAAEMAKLFDGEVTYKNSNDVIVDTPGDPGRAGFVQIIQGRGSDPQRARELMSADSDKWAAFRPDVLGSIVAMHDDGEYTMTVWFTSEAEAREGERKETPPELAEKMAELDKLSVGTPEFFDLKEPWLYGR